MKTKTLEKFQEHMETNRIYFHDRFVDFHLTKAEICDIIQLEFGIRPKRKRIFKKKLDQLIKGLLREITDDII